MLTHLHLVVYTWWCWHIYKGEEIRVVVNQLREEKNVFRCTPNYRMVLGLEYCFDPLWFGSSMHVWCVALWVSFPKYPRSSKSEFGAKSYSHFSAERSVIGRWRKKWSDAGVQRPVSTCKSGHSVQSVFLVCPEATGRWESPVSDDRTRPVAEKRL